MKANKLLKVLSAATIISTLAVVENFTQGNTTFAIENNAVGAKDVKNLPDGEYNITAEALKFYGAEGEASMAAAGLDTTKTKLIVRNGQYFVNVSFKPITFGGLNGYLGDLKYYDGNKTHANRNSIQDSEFNPATIVEYYSTSNTDNFIKTYKKKFPERTAYPKTLSYSVDKNKIDSNNKLETYTQVYVPVMASFGETFGTQRMILKFDLSNALNAVADTQPTPTKPTVSEPTVKPETPKNTQPSNKPAETTTSKPADTKPADTVKPVETPKTTEPAKPIKPVETPKTTEPAKPVKPAETPKSTEPTTTKPTETVKPVETPKPTEPTKPVRPVETPKPKEQPKPVVTTPTPSATATFYKGVKATLLHAYQPGRKSMGDVALEHSNVTVFKEGSTYHYIVRFHDLSIYNFTDGISKFWVNGIEYPVNPTGGANNQKEVHFTSNKKLSTVPVSVFVQAMESIMTGGGKQNATLSFDWSNVTEQQGQPIAGGQPGSSAAGNGAGGLTPKGGRLNNGRLSNTGLETSSTILAGVLTLISAVLVGRRKQK